MLILWPPVIDLSPIAVHDSNRNTITASIPSSAPASPSSTASATTTPSVAPSSPEQAPSAIAASPPIVDTAPTSGHIVADDAEIVATIAVVPSIKVHASSQDEERTEDQDTAHNLGDDIEAQHEFLNQDESEPRNEAEHRPEQAHEAYLEKQSEQTRESDIAPDAVEAEALQEIQTVHELSEAENCQENNCIDSPDIVDMASSVPAKLKTPDLARFILRAAQLGPVKPIIAYWCKTRFLVPIIPDSPL